MPRQSSRAILAATTSSTTRPAIRGGNARLHCRPGRGVRAVFDSVGADTFRGSLAVLMPRGALVQFGKASGSPEPIDPFELAPRALYLTWPILPHYTSTAPDMP